MLFMFFLTESADSDWNCGKVRYLNRKCKRKVKKHDMENKILTIRQQSKRDEPHGLSLSKTNCYI